MTSKTDPDGGVTSYTYDAHGNRTSTTLPDGSTTKYSYDGNGNMTSETDTLGHTTSYTYNDFGQVLTAKDTQGNTTGYSYDPNGNLTSTTDAGGATTHYSYDATGNVTKVTNALGQTTTFGYDEKGNLISATDPAGATTTYAYDAAGNLSSQTDAVGNTTRFIYDSANRLIRTIDAQGGTTSYTYDPAGNKTSETDPNGNTTKYEYNYKGQAIKTTDALGNATTYAYGSTGCASCGGGTDKLRSLTDANGNSTNYQYNSVGKVVTEADPLGNKTSYSYDANGNLASKTDANGATTTYAYDSLGRLLKKNYPDGTAATFTYDARGNVLTAANQNISYTFAYDAAGHVVSVTDSNGRTISYRYDAAGNRTRTVSPDGRTISYSYDSAGRLKSIVDGGTFTFGYDSLGRRSTLTYPNGDMTTYSYDRDGRLTSIIHRNRSGSVIAASSYTLDKVGNRLSNASQDRKVTYQYDGTYRLTEALSSAAGNSSNAASKGSGVSNAIQHQKEWYTYDPVGNRLSSDDIKSYVYNRANQLEENGGKYAYDNNGNLIEKVSSDGKTEYGWDFENRLVKVTTPEGIVVQFAYDPFGRRITKNVQESGATMTTNYYYDGDNILFEYDDGVIGNRYTHGSGIDEHLMVASGKDRYFYHADGLGSVLALTDSTGKTIQTYDYNSFGNLHDHKNRVKQPYTYTGREWDKETGLYYYRARYYDPMEGRFISKDRIGFDGGINLYAYVGNNSTNFTDPSGLARYTAEVEMTSAGELLGGGILRGFIMTQCIGGRRYKGTIWALVGGLTFSRGLPASYTKSSFDLEDNLPGIGDLSNLSGRAYVSSAGYSLGKGNSASVLRLGGAKSVGNPFGGEKGIDLSLNAMGGLALMTDIEREDCCQ